jgi:hypothetical protein
MMVFLRRVQTGSAQAAAGMLRGLPICPGKGRQMNKIVPWSARIR